MGSVLKGQYEHEDCSSGYVCESNVNFYKREGEKVLYVGIKNCGYICLFKYTSLNAILCRCGLSPFLGKYFVPLTFESQFSFYSSYDRKNAATIAREQRKSH